MENTTIDTSGLNELARQFHERAKAKGFWDEKRETGTLLMLIVSELSEALEADRKNRHAEVDNMNRKIEQESELLIKGGRPDVVDSGFVFEQFFRCYVKDTFEDEIADVAIRLLDLIGKMDIDIEKHISLKMQYNATRPYRHGKAY